MIISQNFKKIRIRKRECKENLKISSLINQKRGLKDREKEKISEDIAERIFEKNRKIIIDQVGEMIDNSSNLSRVKMWMVKQKVCPKNDSNYAIAKLNTNGDMVTDKTELKNLYVNVYKSRLKHKEIRPEYYKLKELKNGLFQLRITLVKLRNSEEWKLSDLVKATKNLTRLGLQCQTPALSKV